MQTYLNIAHNVILERVGSNYQVGVECLPVTEKLVVGYRRQFGEEDRHFDSWLKIGL